MKREISSGEMEWKIKKSEWFVFAILEGCLSSQWFWIVIAGLDQRVAYDDLVCEFAEIPFVLHFYAMESDEM